jgi:hypothetical protein
MKSRSTAWNTCLIRFVDNQKFLRMFHGPGDGFFKKGVGDPNLFTVSQMPYFRAFISKVCRKNKVSQGISKKRPWPPEAKKVL